MARAKVRLADNIARVIFIDPDATVGATLGTDVFLPDGSVGSPATIREYLGIGDPDEPEPQQHHRLLLGLTLGDDHPQYTQWVQDENITGQWDFENQTRFQDGTVALPALAFIADDNLGIYRLGADNIGISTGNNATWDVNSTRVQQDVAMVINLPIPAVSGNYVGFLLAGQNLLTLDPFTAGIEMLIDNVTSPTDGDGGAQFGMWEGGVNSGPLGRQYPPAVSGTGYRWRLAGSENSDGDLIFYSHAASSTGVEIYRHARDSGQMFFTRGTVGVPTITFGVGDTPDGDTGVYSPAENQIGLTAGGALRFHVNGSTRNDSYLPFAVINSAGGDPLDRAGFSLDSSGTLLIDLFDNGSGNTYPIVSAGVTAASDIAALMHLDGIDASTTFTDVMGHAFTAGGQAQLDTAQSKFGVSSLLMDGSGDFISSVSNAAWTLGAADFCIEMFVRFNSVAAVAALFSRYNSSGSQRGYLCNFNPAGGGVLAFTYNNGSGASGNNVTVDEAWAPSTGVWYHVAVNRSGADLQLFIDGTQIGTTHNIGASTIFATSQPFRLGTPADAGSTPINGWIDEFRFSHVSRYTSTFTPPSAPFPDPAPVTVEADQGWVFNDPITVPDGSIVQPSIVFDGDEDSGIYLPAADTLGFVTAGVERFHVGPDGEWGIAGANYGTATQIFTSNGSGLPPSWEDAPAGGGGGGGLVYTNTTVPAGNTVASTDYETPFESEYTIAANQLQVGTMVRVKLYGVYGTDASPPDMILRFELDGVTFLATEAITLVGGVTDRGWSAEGVFICHTDGVYGEVEAQGWSEFESSEGVSLTGNMENTATIACDTTLAQTLTATVQWSVADAQNTITLREMVVELMAPADPSINQPALQFLDEGYDVGTPGGITAVDFVGAGVTATESSGILTVAIPGVLVQDEGSDVGYAGTLDFTGSGVSVTDVGGVMTVDISGGAGGIPAIVCTAGLARASNTVLTDDTVLTVALSSGKQYFIEVGLKFSSNTTADLKYDFNYTSTLASYNEIREFYTYAAAGTGAGTTGGQAWASAINTQTTYNFTGNAHVVVTIRITLDTTGAGTFSFRWAQNTSNVGNTTRLTGSYMVVDEGP